MNIIIIIYFLLTTGGLICMKMGGDSISLVTNGFLGFKIGYLTLLGFVLYIGSFILWQKLVVTFDLSYIVPIAAGVVQILVLLAGYFIFKEHINIYSLIGVILVIFGIVLIVSNK